VLNFKNISLRRGTDVLFSGASFTIHKTQKLGITGANGVGKSSFFAFIRNELHPDEGDFTMPPGLQIAHVAQETPAVQCTAIEYVIDGDQELRKLQRQLLAAEQANDGIKQAELHVKLDTLGGYTAQSRASRLLNGLGFLPTQEQKAVAEFSGGWRMRLNLAQALMCRSDVLLLDEPTNHLDLDAVMWLQDWLYKYPGTLLLISHDRDFLDAVADHIINIEQKKAEIYTGNYTAFEKIRAEKLAQQQSAYQKQQQEIAHMQSFVDRFKAKATKAKQAQSRVKALEKMALIAQAHVDSPFDFTFVAPNKLPNPLIKISQASVGYDQTVILKDINLSISPGDRIGLLGPNGAGKSTLIKVLAGEMQPLSGEKQDAEMLKIGYFAQHQLEQLRLDESPLWHLRKINSKATEKELRNYLGGFNFHGDKALEKVAPFSGGEKARLVLALLVYQQPNLLLLDEPTNHLDLEMRHALSVALQEFQGAIILVSHDRHMLRSVTDQLILVANAKVQLYDGDLVDYHQWLIEQKQQNTEKPDTIKAIQPMSRKEQRKLDAERRQKLKPLYDAVNTAERGMEKLHQEQQQLEKILTDPDIYSDAEKDRLKKLLHQKTQLDKLLETTEADWLTASEQLEIAENENNV
jgi:ATP-binding cassette subfamily F protein 3